MRFLLRSTSGLKPFAAGTARHLKKSYRADYLLPLRKANRVTKQVILGINSLCYGSKKLRKVAERILVIQVGILYIFVTKKKDRFLPNGKIRVEGLWERATMIEDYVHLLWTVAIITFISSFILPIVGNIILAYQHHNP